MNKHLILAVTAAVVLVACDRRINTAIPDRAVEKNARIVKSPAREKKQTIDRTIIIYPPGTRNTAENPPMPIATNIVEHRATRFSTNQQNPPTQLFRP